MREIEIKARVQDLGTIIQLLAKQGVVVSEAITHHDRVYGVDGVPGGSENSEPWLRIRTETKQGTTTSYLTLKRSVTSQLDNIEHETTIGDEDETEKLIKQLGFVPHSDLMKTRQKAHMGSIEICLDTVPQLGSFVEVEKLTDDDADYEQVISELWSVLESMDISRDDEVTDGYDVLMNKKLGKD